MPLTNFYLFFVFITFTASTITQEYPQCLHPHQLKAFRSTKKNTTIAGDECKPNFSCKVKKNSPRIPTCPVGNGSLLHPCFTNCVHDAITCIEPDHLFLKESRGDYRIGAIYLGSKNTTTTGEVCSQWRDVTGYSNVYTGNFCFDNGSSDQGPWCVRGQGNETTRELCFEFCSKGSKECIDNDNVKRLRANFVARTMEAVDRRNQWSTSYRRKSVTIYNRTCLKWSDGRIASLLQTESLRGYVKFDDNFCRLPSTNAAVPSCFVEDPNGGVVHQPCFRECHQTSDERSDCDPLPVLASDSAVGRNQCAPVPGFRDKLPRCFRKGKLRMCNEHPDGEYRCRGRNETLFNYRGSRAMDLNGTKCLYWDRIEQEMLARYSSSFERGFDAEENFCRNLDNSNCGPWCFVRDRSSGNITRSVCFRECNEPCKWKWALQNEPEADWLMIKPIINDGTTSNETCSMSSHDRLGQSQTKKITRSSGVDAVCRRSVPDDDFPVTTSSCTLATSLEGVTTSNDRRFCVHSCEDSFERKCIRRSEWSNIYDYTGNHSVSVSGKACQNWMQVKNVTKWATGEVLGHLSADQRLFLFEMIDPKLDSSVCQNLVALAYRKGSLELQRTLPKKQRSLDFFRTLQRFVDFDEEQLKGPWCFVEERSRSATFWKPESCFPVCEDFAVDQLKCIPSEDTVSAQRYAGTASRTKHNGTCAKWSAMGTIGGTTLADLDHNFCRNPNNDPAGPWCYARNWNKSNKRVELKKEHCFEKCNPAQGRKFAQIINDGNGRYAEEDFDLSKTPCYPVRSIDDALEQRKELVKPLPQSEEGLSPFVIGTIVCGIVLVIILGALVTIVCIRRTNADLEAAKEYLRRKMNQISERSDKTSIVHRNAALENKDLDTRHELQQPVQDAAELKAKSALP